MVIGLQKNVLKLRIGITLILNRETGNWQGNAQYWAGLF